MARDRSTATPPVQAGDPAAEQAARRVRDAERELAAARDAAATRLPDGGYVIATEALYVPGGARAHRRGDRVPSGNVARNGWHGKVRPPGDGE